jgi:hypothetical protein
MMASNRPDTFRKDRTKRTPVVRLTGEILERPVPRLDEGVNTHDE